MHKDIVIDDIGSSGERREREREREKIVFNQYLLLVHAC